MDREFMREFYRTNYQHACDVAVADSEEYKKKRDIRYQIEDELTELLGGTGTIEYKKFDDFLGAFEDEKDVMQEEIYLLGAMDREKMLR